MPNQPAPLLRHLEFEMSEALIQKAKNAILADIKKTLPGTGYLEITVESHGGVEYFHQALELLEVQEALRHKRITASIREIDPISKVKAHILLILRRTSNDKSIVFQAYEQDVDLYYSALKLPEISKEIQRKNIEARVQVVDNFGRIKPDIVIATIEDAASKKLDEYL